MISTLSIFIFRFRRLDPLEGHLCPGTTLRIEAISDLTTFVVGCLRCNQQSSPVGADVDFAAVAELVRPERDQELRLRQAAFGNFSCAGQFPRHREYPKLKATQ